MTQTLYPWQLECLNEWKKNDCHGIVNAVTGAGKTRFALECIQYLKTCSIDRPLTGASPAVTPPSSKLRVKIVVPGKSLLFQWKRVLEQTFDADSDTSIGILGNGIQNPCEKEIMIYVINSARYQLARQILAELKEGYTVFLIADECHNYASTENRKIFDFLPYLPTLQGKYCSLGLSATTSEQDYEAVLKPALGREIYHYTLSEALSHGTICDFAIWQIAVEFQFDEKTEYEEFSETLSMIRMKLLTHVPTLKYLKGASFFAELKKIAAQSDSSNSRLARTYLQITYKRKHLVHMAQSRTSCVYHLLKKIDTQKQVIIFGESIEQIEELYLKLSLTSPEKFGRYHSKMGTQANKNTLERFRHGDIRILLTCRALDEGIDVPEATIGIILSGTSMKRQRLQRLGRILRKNDNKHMACLYYLFIADSQEEHAYFPEKTEAFQTYDLFFDDKSTDFLFPKYEQIANLVLDSLHDTPRKICPDTYAEIFTCLNHGYLKGDWLLSPEECHRNALDAQDVRQQNYWLCMEQMSRYSHITDTPNSLIFRKY